jgi:hypothetical protein
MEDETPRFDATDFGQGSLPAPGYYASTVGTARFRRSGRGNDMIQVVHELEGVEPGHDRVSDYFVLTGGSPRGRALSRQRLLELYAACGLEPKAGDPIDPADVLGARLEVKVDHDSWQGRPRLRVVAHRPLGDPDAPGRVPF